MKTLVLGGCGLQGKAALHDLARSPEVDQVICADANLSGLESVRDYLDASKVEVRELDARDKDELVALMGEGIDVVIDLLPATFIGIVSEAVLDAGVHLVNTMYGSMLPPDLDARAQDSGLTVLPEAGLDPGIDLVLCGYAVGQLDQVEELHSYTGGMPEWDAADNPLQYKITWTWDGVLKSYKRPARLMREGRIIDVPAENQFAEEWVGQIDLPGIGTMESIINGDAVQFVNHLGIAEEVRNTTRYSLRWPGHSRLWKTLVDLGFLGDEPVPGLDGLTPHEFMVRHLEPQLAYRDDERDLVVMRNVVKGRKDGKATTIVYDLVDRRDLETGLFGMNRTVGYTASIAAQMVASGTIAKRGVLTAVRDIPHRPFLAELKKRGIRITKTIQVDEEE